MDEKKKRIDDNVYNAAVSAITSGAGAKTQAPTYAGTWDKQIQDTYNKIQNREPFKYDVNGDALYQQYKDKYVQNGKLAMKNAMGQAAGLTGGYGSSYGQAVGQQAFDAQMQNLADTIPELYSLAKQKYDDEGAALKDNLNILQGLQNTEYGQWRDAVGDYRYNDETAYARGRDALSDQRYQDELDYSRSRDALSDKRYDDETAYARARDAILDQRYADETAYDHSRDAISDQRYADSLARSDADTAYSRQQDSYSKIYSMIMGVGYNPTDEDLAAAGMTRQQADILLAYYNRMNPDLTAASSGSGGGGGGSGSGSGTDILTPDDTPLAYTPSDEARSHQYVKPLSDLDRRQDVGNGFSGTMQHTPVNTAYQYTDSGSDEYARRLANMTDAEYLAHERQALAYQAAAQKEKDRIAKKKEDEKKASKVAKGGNRNMTK